MKLPAPHARLDARELKARADLAAIAGRFTRLRRSGRQLLGLCPLHHERHPSFFVHAEKQVFKCFGCGAGGDVFAFVMAATGCDFRRALEIVSESSEGKERARVSREAANAFERAETVGFQVRKADAPNSQSTQESRVRVLAALDEVDRRLARIAATNAAASAALATACEPERGEVSLIFKKRITLHD